jgi:hypothetical protein
VAGDDHRGVLAGRGGHRRGRPGGVDVDDLVGLVVLERGGQIEEAADPVHATFVKRAQRHLGGVGAPAHGL